MKKKFNDEGCPRFEPGEAGSFVFDTGSLTGFLRQDGQSIGLVPVTYKETSTEIATGAGILNHYRVFVRGKRYGYGARRWPSTAELHSDGSVEILWPGTPERPFEVRATYNWVSPYAVDLVTTVRAETKLEAFEIFLASYFSPAFTNSHPRESNANTQLAGTCLRVSGLPQLQGLGGAPG